MFRSPRPGSTSAALLLSLFFLAPGASAQILPSGNYSDYDEDQAAARATAIDARFQALRGRAEQADLALEAASGEQKRLEQRLNELSRKLEHSRQRQQELASSVSQSRSEAERARQEAQKFAGEQQSIQGQLARSRQEVQAIRASESEAQRAYSAAKRQLDELARTQASAQKDVDQKASAVGENQKSTDRYTSQLSEKRSQLEKVRQEFQGIDGMLGQLESEKERVTRENEAKQASTSALRASRTKVDQELASLQSELDAAKKSKDQSRISQLTAKVSAKESEKSQLNTELGNALKEATSLQARVKAAGNMLSSRRLRKSELSGQQRSLEGEIAATGQDLARKQGESASLQAALSSARAALGAATSATAAQQRNTDTAKGRLDGVHQNQAGIERTLNELESRDRTLRSSQAQAEKVQQKMSAQAEFQSNQLAQLRASETGLDSDRRLAAQQLSQVGDSVRNRTVEQASAAAQLQGAGLERTRALQRLEEVRAMILAAQQAVQSTAAAEGASDGDREGQESGQALGIRDGIRDGAALGQTKGTNEGKARDFQAGTSHGSQRGTAKGSADATIAAERDGQAAGTREGRAQGLDAAFRSGREEGLRSGSEQGSDRTAYSQGRTRGEILGHKMAESEAQPLEATGFKEKEAEFRGAALKEVLLGDDVLAVGGAGAQAAGARYGDGRYYSPRSYNYPHPLLNRFYLEAYDGAYRQSLDDAYVRSYRASYDVSSHDAEEQARAKFAVLSYDSEKTRGETEAYDQSYRQTYDASYPAQFEERRSHYYTLAFEPASKDAEARARGFAEGNATASEEKGLNEGRAEAYAGSLPKEQAAASERGRGGARDKYTQAAVLQFVEARLQDSDQNGVHAPGDQLALELVVRNYGLKPKVGLLARLLIKGENVSSRGEADVSLPPIPPQSEARIRGVGRMEILPQAREGAAFSVRVEFLDASKSGSEIRLFEQVLASQVRYPVKVQPVDFGGSLQPNSPTQLRLKFTNQSTRTQDLLVTLAVDGAKVAVQNPQLAVSGLAPRQSTEIRFALTGRLEANYESAPLTVESRAGKREAAARLEIPATVLQRHQVTQGSIGLLLSADLGQSGGKHFALSAPLDSWDVKVDGPILKAEDLKPYLTKSVQLLIGEGAMVDPATCASLQAYLARGGALTIWGGELERSGILKNLDVQMGVTAARPAQLNARVLGQAFLTGMDFDFTGESAALTLSNRSVPLLVYGSEVLGAMSRTAEFSDAPGRVVTLALDPARLETASIQKFLNLLQLEHLDFKQKLTAAGQSPEKLNWVLEELKEELQDLDLRPETRFNRNSQKLTKLHRAMSAFLETRSSAHTAFVAAFPVIARVAVTMRNPGARQEALRLLESVSVGGGLFGMGSRTWKDFHCKGNGAEYCRRGLEVLATAAGSEVGARF